MQEFFSTPILTKEMTNFQEEKSHVIGWLMDDRNYITSGKKNGLLITDANLHKNPKFRTITDFMRKNVWQMMFKMGYHPDFVITSMWATKQEFGAYHHLHCHKNAFLGSAMYIHADSPTDGTTFVNPLASMWQMEPKYSAMVQPYVEPSVTMPFDEGTAHVFPGWLQHYTAPNRSNCRIVIAMNVMPVGKTNRDHYDRYEFPDKMELLEIEKEVFTSRYTDV